MIIRYFLYTVKDGCSIIFQLSRLVLRSAVVNREPRG